MSGLSRRGLLAAGAGAVVVGAGGAAAALGPASWRHRLGLASSPDRRFAPSGARLTEGTFTSRHMRQPVGWGVAVPPGGSVNGIVYCLHAKGQTYRMAFDRIHVHDAVAAAGAPLAVAACDGGSDSYWHPRADGTDAMAMFFEEFVPLVERQVDGRGRRALMGWSMGGYGSLLFAEQRPDLFRCVAVASAALWTSPGATAPGAFDSAADYHRWDVFAGVGRLDSLVARLDCGTGDPFIAADRAFAARLPAGHPGSFSAGFHDDSYWRSVAPAQVTTIAAAV